LLKFVLPKPCLLAFQRAKLWERLACGQKALMLHREPGEAGVGLTQVSGHQFGKAGIFAIVYGGGVGVAGEPDDISDAMALTEG
jgi:hypothetical protein